MLFFHFVIVVTVVYILTNASYFDVYSEIANFLDFQILAAHFVSSLCLFLCISPRIHLPWKMIGNEKEAFWCKWKFDRQKTRNEIYCRMRLFSRLFRHFAHTHIFMSGRIRLQLWIVDVKIVFQGGRFLFSW